MKYELKPSDLKEIKNIDNDMNMVHFKLAKKLKYNIGDIVVKKFLSYDDDDRKNPQIKTELYDNSVVPRRWLVIHESEGIYYFKEFMGNGKLTGDITCSYNTDDYDYDGYSYFEVDPQAVDSILLGQDYDVAALLKEENDRKAVLIAKNKKNSVVLETLKEANTFIKGLKAGDTFYYHSKEDFANNSFATVKLEREPYKVSKETLANGMRLRRARYTCDARQLRNKFVYYFTSQNMGVQTTLDLVNMAVYKEVPINLSGDLWRETE